MQPPSAAAARPSPPAAAPDARTHGRRKNGSRRSSRGARADGRTGGGGAGGGANGGGGGASTSCSAVAGVGSASAGNSPAGNGPSGVSVGILLGPPPPEPATLLLPSPWYLWLWQNPKAQFAWILVALSLSACLSNSWQPYSSLLFGHEVFLNRCSDYEIEIHREERAHNSGDDFGRYEPACAAQNSAIGLLYASGNIATTAFMILARTMMQRTPPYRIAAIGVSVLLLGFFLLGVAPASHGFAFALATLCIGGSWGFVMGPGGDACGYWGRYKNYAHALVVAANSCSSFVISVLDSLVRHTPPSFRAVVLGYTAGVLFPVALSYVAVVFLAKKRALRDRALLSAVEDGAAAGGATPPPDALLHALAEPAEAPPVGKLVAAKGRAAGAAAAGSDARGARAAEGKAHTRPPAGEGGVEAGGGGAAAADGVAAGRGAAEGASPAGAIRREFDDGILDPFCIPIRSTEESHLLLPSNETSLEAVLRRPEFMIFCAVMMVSATGMHFYTVTLRSVAGENVARFLGFLMPLVLLWDCVYGLSVNFVGMTFLWFVQLICLGLAFVCTFASRWGWRYFGTVLYTLCSAFSGHLVYVFTNEYLPPGVGWKAQNVLNIFNIASVLANSALTNVTYDMRYVANCILGAILVALLGISAFEVFVKNHERRRRAGARDPPGAEAVLLHHPDCAALGSPGHRAALAAAAAAGGELPPAAVDAALADHWERHRRARTQ